jgi:hypothetical protein
MHGKLSCTNKSALSAPWQAHATQAVSMCPFSCSTPRGCCAVSPCRLFARGCLVAARMRSVPSTLPTLVLIMAVLVCRYTVP